jgi:hypothetical protein
VYHISTGLAPKTPYERIIVGQSFGEPVPEPIEDPEIVALKEENASLREEIDRLNKLLEPPTSPKINILDFQVKIMQKGDTYWEFSWNLTLANDLAEAADFNVDILFLDSEDFIIDHDYDFFLTLGVGESKTFRGDKSIKAGIAAGVAGYEVVLDW